jgi:5-methylcytosine-specific restriction endonuclease McrA
MDSDTLKEVMMPRDLLNQKTLILNKHWMPIDVTRAFHAINLVYRGAALFVDPETYAVYKFSDWIKRPQQGACIRSVWLSIQVPEVLLLIGFDKPARQRVPFTKKNVFMRDLHTCQYCNKQSASDKLTVDHIIPRSKGGTNSWLNCVSSCRKCNSKKGNKSIREAKMKLLTQPKIPNWDFSIRSKLGNQLPRLKHFIEKKA